MPTSKDQEPIYEDIFETFYYRSCKAQIDIAQDEKASAADRLKAADEFQKAFLFREHNRLEHDNNGRNLRTANKALDAIKKLKEGEE